MKCEKNCLTCSLPSCVLDIEDKSKIKKQKRTKEEIAKQKHDYYEAHKDKILQRHRERYQANRDEINERAKRYYAEHREEIRKRRNRGKGSL